MWMSDFSIHFEKGEYVFFPEIMMDSKSYFIDKENSL